MYTMPVFFSSQTPPANLVKRERANLQCIPPCGLVMRGVDDSLCDMKRMKATVPAWPTTSVRRGRPYGTAVLGVLLALPGGVGLVLLALGPAALAQFTLLVIMTWSVLLATGASLSCTLPRCTGRGATMLGNVALMGAPLSLALPLLPGILLLTIVLLAAGTAPTPNHSPCRALRLACAALAPIMALSGGMMIAAP